MSATVGSPQSDLMQYESKKEKREKSFKSFVFPVCNGKTQSTTESTGMVLELVKVLLLFSNQRSKNMRDFHLFSQTPSGRLWVILITYRARCRHWQGTECSDSKRNRYLGTLLLHLHLSAIYHIQYKSLTM